MDKISLDMERDKFFKPEEAREYGLIDRVISSHEFKANPTGFRAGDGNGDGGGGDAGGEAASA
jgi:Clp protease